MRGRKRHRKKETRRVLARLVQNERAMEELGKHFRALIESEMRRGEFIHNFVESCIGDPGDDVKAIWAVRE